MGLLNKKDEPPAKDYSLDWAQWAFAQTNPGKSVEERIADAKLLLAFVNVQPSWLASDKINE